MTEETKKRFWAGSRTRYLLVAVIAALVLVLGLAACGGGGNSGTTEEATTEEAAGGETGGTEEAAEEESGGSSVAQAEETIAPFIGQPSPFPVTDKLKEIPKGATVPVMDCGTPVCALFWELLSPAAAAMGIHVERIKAGQAANTVSAAFQTALAKEPDAVIVLAIDIHLWQQQLKELQEDKIPVITTGIGEAEEFGIVSPQGADPGNELAGKLLANYVTVEMGKNVVFYEVPELTFTTLLAEVFTKELEAACPECSVRTAKVSASELGSTAPNTIVSDLQANPETETAVFATGEISAGLAPALQAAGINVETISFTPTPTNLQYLKEGKETAALGLDLPVLMWTMVDQTAREIIGQKLTGPEAEGIPVLQFLTQKDIKFNPAKGWTGYPEFAERFAKLWGLGG